MALITYRTVLYCIEQFKTGIQKRTYSREPQNKPWFEIKELKKEYFKKLLKLPVWYRTGDRNKVLIYHFIHAHFNSTIQFRN